ncbi:Cullin 3 [Capronia coronata CBS 617.96]|uniref:Cullin 3 n=1 Tax=Capronia coronata CBS 617.96 TaxID=1182541 RepID=W9YNJ5_9EURO|nr:Cullin 3 [Capronia coronata CBS 617.96]EXJ90806.1 Cullin 3 [Capronia coronata CBS 617.96]
MLAKGRGGKIRAPRRGLTKDDVDFDSVWNTLSTAFLEIHSKNASRLSFEELFRNAYKLVLKKKQDFLYDRVVQLEESWLRDHVRPRILGFITPTMTVGSLEQATGTQSNERRIAGERFIRAVTDAFADHQLSMGMITDVLMYMDRVNSQDQRRPSIFATAMALFRTHVLRTPLSEDASFDVLLLLETVVLDMIRMERSGEVIDRPLVRACCYMLEGLYESFTEDESTKLYLTSFEPQFIAASRQFYQEEGKTLLAEADASTFCTHASRRLLEETERCQQTISQITETKIKHVVDEELISTHIRDVINMQGTGVKYMLDNDKIEDLANVFDLISRVDPKKVALKDAVQKRVIELGTDINKSANVISEAPPQPRTAAKTGADAKAAPEKTLSQQTQAAIAWVEQILELKNKFDRVWVEAFRRDGVMEKALEISFQDFINANDRSPEHLSLFLDEYLKRGGRDKTDAEVDALLDNGILLLQYLANKDLFETYYKKHMAKRLLMKKSVSREMERQMLSKMKMKIGNQFTQKLEGLIRDTELSDSLSTQYKEYVNKLGDPDPRRIDLDCRVLTTTVWPFETLFRADNDDESRRECKFPAPVERIRQRFQKFYLDKHTGRKLTWMPSLGDADLRATFTTGGKTRRYEVNVSTYGMVILMLFNDLAPGESLTTEQIAAETNIPKHDLIRNLQSLSLVSKWRLLKKEPMSKDIKPTDKFYFNEDFSSQFLKIKVSVVAGGANRIENSEERRATQKRTDDERGHVIEAAIVRIMKSRKTASHSQLMTETLHQLSGRFQPDVNMIKKKIEALIDREYLERGSDPAKPTYNYLA